VTTNDQAWSNTPRNCWVLATHTHYNCSLPAAVGPNGVAKMAKRAWSEVATDYDVPSLVTETVPESAVPPTGPEES